MAEDDELASCVAAGTLLEVRAEPKDGLVAWADGIESVLMRRDIDEPTSRSITSSATFFVGLDHPQKCSKADLVVCMLCYHSLLLFDGMDL
jgi:hypothetical protein